LAALIDRSMLPKGWHREVDLCLCYRPDVAYIRIVTIHALSGSCRVIEDDVLFG